MNICDTSRYIGMNDMSGSELTCMTKTVNPEGSIKQIQPIMEDFLETNQRSAWSDPLSSVNNFKPY